MCGEKVSKEEVLKIDDIQAYLYQKDEQAEKEAAAAAAALGKPTASAAEQAALKAAGGVEPQEAVDIEVKF
jgi:hypothetical protein